MVTQGSYFFMALELMRSWGGSLAYPHLPRHDLESSHWVLLWVVLRHTHCCLHWKKKPGKLVCADLFKPLDDSDVGHALKLTSLLRTYYDSLDVASNDPLTTLVEPWCPSKL